VISAILKQLWKRSARKEARQLAIALLGDSDKGYGSVEAVGDLQGNYGWYEQAIANRYKQEQP
jgi:hypothetical protein